MESRSMEQELDVLKKSPLSTFEVYPKRIVWTSDLGVSNSQSLLDDKPGQAILMGVTTPTSIGPGGSILIDFGREISGWVEIVTPVMPEKDRLRKARIRLGESVSEAMSEIGEASNASNDCAIRDQVVELAWLGKTMVGPGGFRFMRIDNLEADLSVELDEVRAMLQIRDIPYLGSFRSSDERLNEIWLTGARTVHLNMQDYLWDGIKRDRLVWLGDMHPEVRTILAVFGVNEVVTDSLDLIRHQTPVETWMNSISSYSLWWIIIHSELWLQTGDQEYLAEQETYMTELLYRLLKYIGEDGRESLDGVRFVDWPTYGQKDAVHEGLQALMVMTMQSGGLLMSELGNSALSEKCREAAKRLMEAPLIHSGRKAPAALAALAGIKDAGEIAESILKVDGPSDLSTFYGYYVLDALAEADDIETGIDFISQYWGGMFDLGATTFWENFDLSWLDNAARIDELVPEGKVDVHATYGEHSYKGLRNSLCHGWASGPTAWLSEFVLGISPASPGFETVYIEPRLATLEWVEGTYPTPRGVIHVSHRRSADGSVSSDVDLPAGIKVVRRP
ncbi:alpha-L-rhamnosidase C-terminal domain-containing protein [Pelagicoccus sp. SDUM812002]|uniref:alpha-L-rhamnosidase-related protein n=1 Tax=Pelagicoccus sp. SDUM812002 TaxID=3041266 RepID=UPI00280FF50F|nr:alpha-L-rhamnosidase C-terminal domain-containing protein [Pelagicoccus sp. SDUM812002]MDQ8187191.1 alpha-L-rhamnosidase C-terminal domain-containing protein [Pelagicoccus sp. SDUM812002]